MCVGVGVCGCGWVCGNGCGCVWVCVCLQVNVLTYTDMHDCDYERQT